MRHTQPIRKMPITTNKIIPNLKSSIMCPRMRYAQSTVSFFNLRRWQFQDDALGNRGTGGTDVPV